MLSNITKLFTKKSKHRLKAVQDKDLKKYLKSIGIYEKIVSEKINCKYCGNPVNIESLQAILPDDGKVSVICHNKRCINQL